MRLYFTYSHFLLKALKFLEGHSEKEINDYGLIGYTDLFFLIKSLPCK